jgi:hypothetical protein
MALGGAGRGLRGGPLPLPGRLRTPGVEPGARRCSAGRRAVVFLFFFFFFFFFRSSRGGSSPIRRQPKAESVSGCERAGSGERGRRAARRGAPPGGQRGNCGGPARSRLGGAPLRGHRHPALPARPAPRRGPRRRPEPRHRDNRAAAGPGGPIQTCGRRWSRAERGRSRLGGAVPDPAEARGEGRAGGAPRDVSTSARKPGCSPHSPPLCAEGQPTPAPRRY